MLKIGVSSYSYPVGTWTTWLSGGQTALTVVNPASGPGTSVDPNYSAIIGTAHGVAGNKVIGYVATGYTSKTLATVQAEIDAWYAMYPAIDGIFFDEVSNSCSNQSYYETLTTYADTKGASHVALNFGVSAPVCFDFQAAVPGVQLILCTFEGPQSTYNTYTPPSWESTAQSKIWHLIYSADPSSVSFSVSRANANNVDYIYVTDDTMVDYNPWDTISGACWSNLVAAVAAGTTPVTVTLNALPASSYTTGTTIPVTGTVTGNASVTVQIGTSTPVAASVAGGVWSANLIAPSTIGTYSVVASSATITSSPRSVDIVRGVSTTNTYDCSGYPSCGPGSGAYKGAPANAAQAETVIHVRNTDFGIQTPGYHSFAVDGNWSGFPVCADAVRGATMRLVYTSDADGQVWLKINTVRVQVDWVDEYCATHSGLVLLDWFGLVQNSGNYTIGVLSSIIPANAKAVVGVWAHVEGQFSNMYGEMHDECSLLIDLRAAACGPNNGVDVVCTSGSNVNISMTNVSLTDVAIPDHVVKTVLTIQNSGVNDLVLGVLDDPLPPSVASRTWIVKSPTNGVFSQGTSGSGALHGTLNIPAKNGSVNGIVTIEKIDSIKSDTTDTQYNGSVALAVPVGTTNTTGAVVLANAIVPIRQGGITASNVASPTSVTNGDKVFFTLKLKNNGGITDPAIVFGDSFAGLTSVSWTSNSVGGFGAAGTGAPAGTVSLIPGQELVIQVSGFVADVVNQISNTLTVTPSVYPTNSPVTVIVPVLTGNTNGSLDDLTVSKTAAAPEVTAGDDVKWTLTIRNDGDKELIGVTVDDYLPANIQSMSWIAAASGVTGYAASGFGEIHATLRFPVGSQIVYNITGKTLKSTFGETCNSVFVGIATGQKALFKSPVTVIRGASAELVVEPVSIIESYENTSVCATSSVIVRIEQPVTLCLANKNYFVVSKPIKVEIGGQVAEFNTNVPSFEIRNKTGGDLCVSDILVWTDVFQVPPGQVLNIYTGSTLSMPEGILKTAFNEVRLGKGVVTVSE